MPTVFDPYPLLRPCLFQLPAETAHDLAVWWLAHMPALARRVNQRLYAVHDPILAQRLWQLDFANPVGIAAGLDKNAVGIAALAAFGVSHVEVGTVTGQAQGGNPRPRLFRLLKDQAVINRMGFNNRGAVAVAAQLAAAYDPRGGTRRPPSVLGINLGKTKSVPLDQALDDYQASVAALGPFADYLVVNVSSPNTPGLRDLQDEGRLRPLLAGVHQARQVACPGTPLLLKIAPDLADAGVDAAVDAALEAGCDGLIATNTTISRDGLSTPPERVQGLGAGGLSGPPVRTRSDAVLARVARRLRQRGSCAPVIGVGGIDSPAAAWAKIGLGASLVQVYTAFIYHGPALLRSINLGLAARVRAAGLPSIAAAVGRDL